MGSTQVEESDNTKVFEGVKCSMNKPQFCFGQNADSQGILAD